MGTETMICFSGLRRTLYRPGSSLSSCAAWSKRSIIASNGFSSARKVSFSGRIICRSVWIAGSLMILASGSVPTGHSVQSVFQHRAVPLPLDGKPRDQRLGHVARPPAAELHGVLLSDYNIIRPGRASHEAREIGLRVGVMILIRLELHDSAETAQLRCERLRIGDPSSRQDAAPGEHRQLMARSEERRVGKECRSRWSPY